MKILHLTKKYPPLIGGDSLVVYNLEKEQKKVGHDVHILTSNCDSIKDGFVLKFGLKEEPFDLDRINIRRILSLILLSFWGFNNLNKIKPKIIHSHSADLGFFISFPARLYGINIVNTCHGISFDDMQYPLPKRFAEKFFLKCAGFKKIVAVDNKGLQKLQGTQLLNSAYVPNGIELDRFQFQNLDRRRNNNRIKFLFVGRLEEQKGLIYLIKAAEKILRQYTDFEIIIIGDGSEYSNLMKMTMESSLGGIIKFKGQIDDKKLDSYYAECDSFVLPSIWEGLPLTLLEAASARMSIIASNVGGISSFFTNGENILLVEPKNIDSLVLAMIRLKNDKNLRKKIGDNARNLIEKSNLSWKNTSKIYEEIYSN